MFNPLFPIFLLTTLLSTLTLTLAPPPVNPHCGHLGLRPPNPADCTALISQLQTQPWFTRRTTYGDNVPEPGTTPITLSHGSCTFQMFNAPNGPQHLQSERIRLSDYTPQLEEVVSMCLADESGFDMGAMVLGKRNRFFAYIGGHMDRGAAVAVKAGMGWGVGGVRVNGTE